MNFETSDVLFNQFTQPPKAARGMQMQSTSSTGDEQRYLDTPLSDDSLASLNGHTAMSKRAAHDIANRSAPPRKRRKGRPSPSSSPLMSSVGVVGSSTHGSSGSSSSIEHDQWGIDNELKNKRKFSAVGRSISRDPRFKKRWKLYENAAVASLKKNRARENSDVVARAHGQKVASLQAECKHTFRQLRANNARYAAKKKGSSSSSSSSNNNNSNDSTPSVQPSLPQQGWSKIQEARMVFAAASRGLQGAERRQRTARLAQQSFLDAASTLIAARRHSEENLRLALAQAHPHRDLLRWRLERDLRHSIADTSEIVLLSTTRLLSRASTTAMANAKVDIFSREKLAARLNRERQICRVNGAGGDSSPRFRLSRVKCRRKFSIPLPRRTNALLEPQASVPDSTVSPRLQVVFSQLRAIETAAAKSSADAQG